jgi:uncharacterized membrane protein
LPDATTVGCPKLFKRAWVLSNLNLKINLGPVAVLVNIVSGKLHVGQVEEAVVVVMEVFSCLFSFLLQQVNIKTVSDIKIK